MNKASTDLEACRNLFVSSADATILSDRRARRPYGLAGGEDGSPGCNELLSKGTTRLLPAKTRLIVQRGETLRIESLGGGGWGLAKS